MKTKFIMFIVLFTSVFVGCKDDKSVDDLEVKKSEVATSGFKITINAIVNQDDSFQIFFNEDGSESYDGTQMIDIPVKGKAEAQDLVFSLPEDAKPMNLRFDIGSNSAQKSVKFNSLKIDFNGKSFTTDGAKFFKYFYPNGQVECDTINATAKIVEKPNEIYDPIIGATPDLKKEIENLYKK